MQMSWWSAAFLAEAGQSKGNGGGGVEPSCWISRTERTTHDTRHRRAGWRDPYRVPG